MAPLRIGLVGCGKVGGLHAAALRAVPDVDFVAACDADFTRAESFAARFHVRPYSDLGMMLRDAGIQAIIVGTPHPRHAAPAIQALEAGVHVLVEKPLAANLGDCDAMIAAAK